VNENEPMTSSNFNESTLPPPPPPPFDDFDIPPPPPPADDFGSEPLEEEIEYLPPPPPIEETPQASVLKSTLTDMAETYLSNTGEEAPMELKQEWAGELFRQGEERTNKLHEIGLATARMSIDSRLKARAHAVPGKHNKKFT